MLSSHKGRSLTARMPAHRLLTETDGPFGMASGKPLQPGECAEAIRVLAELWRLDEVTARKNVVASFRKLAAG